MPERTAEAGHLHSADGTPVILHDVRFSYRGDEVLRGACMSVAAGEICALVGDNGAGKSTIARLVVGEIMPASGTVELFGEDPARFRDWARVGYVPQLLPEAVSRFPASVSELVDASQYASARGIGRKERHKRSMAALERVGMRGFVRHLISELSGGQLQRVRLACALVGDPCLLILDEPTNGLDSESREVFYRLVGEAHAERGMAVLLVTHDLGALAGLGAKVVRIRDGLAWPEPQAEASASAALAPGKRGA